MRGRSEPSPPAQGRGDGANRLLMLDTWVIDLPDSAVETAPPIAGDHTHQRRRTASDRAVLARQVLLGSRQARRAGARTARTRGARGRDVLLDVVGAPPAASSRGHAG